MSGYVKTRADNGGVHINSGIPNKAFYNAANDLGGNSWQTPGQIWFKAAERLRQAVRSAQPGVAQSRYGRHRHNAWSRCSVSSSRSTTTDPINTWVQGSKDL
jgi:Zn-dependent metalloprotease